MIITTIIIFVLLLFLSAFFSGSETAYFNIKEHKKDIPESVLKLLKDPRKLLVSLLTGNTLVNVGLAFMSAIIATKIAQNYGLSESLIVMFEVLLVSAIILVFGEIIPKLIAIRQSENFATTVNLPLRTLILILYPIAFVFYSITSLVMKLMPKHKEKIFDSEEELIILTELGEEEGTLQEEESDMIQSIFEFKDKMVREIITPRVDMVALQSSTTIDEVMDIINDKQFSKIPVYKDTIDNIKGILYAKDLVPYLMGSRPNVNLVSIARQPFFVPENKRIDELLNEFKSRKTNIAIVVDEWGGTSGLVTLEDVVEEVLGEIRDPYDKDEFFIKQESDGSFLVDASISIYDFEEETEIEFPEEREYDTLGGLIFDFLGDIPKPNEEIEYLNRKFTVINLEGNRIGKILVSPPICDIPKDRLDE